MVSDLFCAFHPNRVMVPSLPERLRLPAMPSAVLVLLATLASSAVSGTFSTSPSPNVEMGIRKLRFPQLAGLLPLPHDAPAWAAKGGCAALQAGASVRPAMVNRP